MAEKGRGGEAGSGGDQGKAGRVTIKLTEEQKKAIKERFGGEEIREIELTEEDLIRITGTNPYD